MHKRNKYIKIEKHTVDGYQFVKHRNRREEKAVNMTLMESLSLSFGEVSEIKESFFSYGTNK